MKKSFKLAIGLSSSLLLVGILPSILSIFFTSTLTPSNLNIQRARLSWLGPQKLYGINSDTNKLQLHFPTLEIKAPLWAFFFPTLFPNEHVLMCEKGVLKSGSQDIITNIAADASFSASKRKLLCFISATKGEGKLEGSLEVKSVKALPINLLSLIADPHKQDYLHHLQIDIKNLPADSLGYSPIDGSILAYIFRKEGQISFDLHNKESFVRAKTTLMRQSLFLDDPLTLRCKMTPQILDFLFDQKCPITSFDPIDLEISPEGFSIPLDSLSEAKAPKITIDLHQIRWDKNYLVSLLTDKLQLDHKPLIIDFDKAHLRIENEKLYLDQTNLKIDPSLSLTLSGKLRFKDQTLRLKLGIPVGDKTFEIPLDARLVQSRPNKEILALIN